MTASVGFITVADSISKLSISGVTVKDVDQIPESAAMITPVLFPDPNGYISNIQVTRDEFTGQWNTLTYTMNYRYIHCPAAGGLGGVFASYSGLVTKIAAILLAFASDATLAGAIDNDSPTISELGVIEDPAGNQFLGCLFSLNIKQFLEV